MCDHFIITTVKVDLAKVSLYLELKRELVMNVDDKKNSPGIYFCTQKH